MGFERVGAVGRQPNARTYLGGGSALAESVSKCCARSTDASRASTPPPTRPRRDADPGGERGTPTSLSRTRAHTVRNARRIFDGPLSSLALQAVAAPRSARPAISVLADAQSPLSASKPKREMPSARQSRTACRRRFYARRVCWFAERSSYRMHDPLSPIAPEVASLPETPLREEPCDER